ncbi:ATP synthase F0 subunit B [bacterium]|nr:ATP synthase F0 subunit B [bacterium]|tara:strand:- start:153 stop:605 length:453 start_codon:yes stop_codon:yes gene_type:complete
MDQLIQAFGIDVKLITVQVINFGILLAALTYFLYKPVLNLLNEREETIAQGIKDAEAAAAAKADAESEKQTILQAAHHEAGEVTARAKAAATEQSDKIVAEAQVKASRVLADAEAAGEERKRVLEQESEAEVAKLAMLAAEKILRQGEAK